jgi:chaperonin cofactor prefoldin
MMQFTSQAPRTADELRAMVARRDELRSQLESLTEQRSNLAEQIGDLHSSDPAVRAGPVARLKAMDERITRLERDIQAADDQVATAKANGVSVPAPAVDIFPSPPATPEVPSFVWTTGEHVPWRERMLDSLQTSGPIALATVVLLGATIYWWISRSVRNQLTKLVAMQSAKLEELQRSVDTVAVEVERVSENQRFVTKLVGDKQPTR